MKTLASGRPSSCPGDLLGFARLGDPDGFRAWLSMARPARGRRWCASGLGSFLPGPWFLAGDGTEARSRVAFPAGIAKRPLTVGGFRHTLSGPSPDPSPAKMVPVLAREPTVSQTTRSEGLVADCLTVVTSTRSVFHRLCKSNTKFHGQHTASAGPRTRSAAGG